MQNSKLTYVPFVICEFVSVVVRGHHVHQQNVFSLGVEARDFNFEAGEHSSVKRFFFFLGEKNKSLFLHFRQTNNGPMRRSRATRS